MILYLYIKFQCSKHYYYCCPTMAKNIYESAEFLPLHQPCLDDVCSTLQNALENNFESVSVRMAPCPNLTQAPFHLAAAGLSGSPRIAEVGGVAFLAPLPQKDRYYSLREVALSTACCEKADCGSSKSCGGLATNSFIIGAGAGPFREVGKNSELMANCCFANDRAQSVNDVIESRIAVLKPGDAECELRVLKENSDFALLGNFFMSQGLSGEVIEVQAATRKGPQDFAACVRESLAARFSESIGVGGVFLIERGRAKLHIMPDFSETPLLKEVDINEWLKYFEMDAPLVCLSVLMTHDPGYSIRLEHTHCFSQHGQGGHYHYDTTPDIVKYKAYLNIAKTFHRIDRPE